MCELVWWTRRNRWRKMIEISNQRHTKLNCRNEAKIISCINHFFYKNNSLNSWGTQSFAKKILCALALFPYLFDCKICRNEIFEKHSFHSTIRGNEKRKIICFGGVVSDILSFYCWWLIKNIIARNRLILDYVSKFSSNSTFVLMKGYITTF